MAASKTATPAKNKRKARATKRKSKKAGRPEFSPTRAQREKVEILVGGGMSVEEIAAAMDVAKNTLKKHFGPELLKGRSKKRAEMLEAMFNSGKGGNVAAQKAFMLLNGLADADDKVQNAGNEPVKGLSKAATAYRGKKEAAQEEAMTAGVGSEWGSDLDPSAPNSGVKPN